MHDDICSLLSRKLVITKPTIGLIMAAAKRVKKNSGLTTVCAARGCTNSIIIDTAVVSATEEENHYNSRVILFCDDCFENCEGTEFFSCHLNPSVIQFSTRPLVVPVNAYLGAFQASYAPWAAVNNCAQDYILAADILSKAEKVLVIAGAGMSAESFSGSTFRSSGGTKLGGSRSATDIDYTKNPAAAWYYDASIRRTAVSNAPHGGYAVLLNYLQEKDKDYFVLTSNIDSYFLTSGYAADRIYETHGSICYIQCKKRTSAGRCPGIWSWKGKFDKIQLDDEECLANLDTVPRCPKCHGPARANISHESDDLEEDLDRSRKAPQTLRFYRWLQRAQNASVAILEIGAGESVHGLRVESDLLLSAHPDSGLKMASLIRVDPHLSTLPRPTTCFPRVVGLQHTTTVALGRLLSLAHGGEACT